MDFTLTQILVSSILFIFTYAEIQVPFHLFIFLPFVLPLLFIFKWKIHYV